MIKHTAGQKNGIRFVKDRLKPLDLYISQETINETMKRNGEMFGVPYECKDGLD